MLASHRLAALALTMALFAPVAADAMDDSVRASSSGPTELRLCGEDGVLASSACKERDFDALTAQIEKALRAALAKAPANIKPLLKRDQVWFDEIMLNAAESMPQSDDAEVREAFVATLRKRIATMEGIAAGIGRRGIAGRWANAFGSVDVTPADNGTYRIAIETRAVYGADEEQHWECQASALLRPEPGGWLSGTILARDGKPAPANDGDGATATTARPALIKIRRQGETLRVVVTDPRDGEDPKLPGCKYTDPITASYFASGKADAAATTAASAFVAPTFDCVRPLTATDEEICADPELAGNDQRLNRAWKALLPRLDPTTRRSLTEDQRNWLRAMTGQYPESLHPGRNKISYFVHFTGDARHALDRLQRERIALLEGFEENRRDFAGIWLAHNAILKVTSAEDGSLSAKGRKWDPDDYKTGCEYEIKGKVIHGVFHSEEKRKNPDTLERDHATLIVNRQDDAFAKQRWRTDGTADADEAKCSRSLANSSTARLFPARPSPDIDDRHLR